jgi:ribosomal 50S subunit-associated protein YjgA (DUF615 family)
MTKDDIILMADASGISYYGMGRDRDKFLHYLEAFATLVVAAEREACAKVADGWPDYDVQGLAEAIRARGNT